MREGISELYMSIPEVGDHGKCSSDVLLGKETGPKDILFCATYPGTMSCYSLQLARHRHTVVFVRRRAMTFIW